MFHCYVSLPECTSLFFPSWLVRQPALLHAGFCYVEKVRWHVAPNVVELSSEAWHGGLPETFFGSKGTNVMIGKSLYLNIPIHLQKMFRFTRFKTKSLTKLEKKEQKQ